MSFANPRTAMHAYRRVSVESLIDYASPQRIVVMLFDGARGAVAAANAHLKRGDVAAKGKAVSQAIAIIDGGLRGSLDLSVGGDLAKNLFNLYTYMIQRLLHANLANDPAALDEVSKLLEQLGGAWESIAARPAIAAAHPSSGGPPRSATREA